MKKITLMTAIGAGNLGDELIAWRDKYSRYCFVKYLMFFVAFKEAFKIAMNFFVPSKYEKFFVVFEAGVGKIS